MAHLGACFCGTHDGREVVAGAAVDMPPRCCIVDQLLWAQISTHLCFDAIRRLDR